MKEKQDMNICEIMLFCVVIFLFGLGASYFFFLRLAEKVNFPASWTRLDRSGTPWSYRKFGKTITSLWAYVNI